MPENDQGSPIWPGCPPDLFRCYEHAEVNRPFTDEERKSYLRHLVALALSATQDTITDVAYALTDHASDGFYGAFAAEAPPWSKPCGCTLPDPWDPRYAPNAGCHVYRLWGPNDRLLYVGVSTKLRNRLRSHLRRWGDLVQRVTWEEHPDERSMLAAEDDAIRGEDPALNKAGV